MNIHFSNSEHEHYLSMAAEYDNRLNAILPRNELFFSSCLSFIPEDQITLLELGSGTGYATYKIHEVNPRAVITCIDHSAEMIACARQKSDLESVQILKQDIRDPWPDEQYNVIMTTLCLHHITREDRLFLLHRVYNALIPGGLFICGDIIRPDSEVAEKIYREHWIKYMIQSGLSMEEINKITTSRRVNFPEMETIGGLYKKLKEIGFSPILIPYSYEISAIFIGYR